MNQIILMGRLVKDPDVRISQGQESLAIARYTLAVNRGFKKQGEPDADFIMCVAFSKAAEFAEKYLKKGNLIAVTGRLQVRSWYDKDGNKHWSTEVIVEKQYFTGINKNITSPKESLEGDEEIQIKDEDLPF